jgi:hypothetical protein
VTDRSSKALRDFAEDADRRSEQAGRAPASDPPARDARESAGYLERVASSRERSR